MLSILLKYLKHKYFMERNTLNPSVRDTDAHFSIFSVKSKLFQNKYFFYDGENILNKENKSLKAY